MSVSSVHAFSMRLFAFVAVLATLTPSMLTQAHSSSASTATNQASSSPASPSSSNLLPTLPTSTSPEIPPAVTHKIRVGLGDHKFTPDTVTAAQGDTIEFSFFPTNHSVVRAEWNIPCIPYEMTGPGKAGSGFFSGFQPVDTVLENPPTFSIMINDTSPIFFYCSAPGACTTYGMVGIINPNASTSLDEQRNLALKATYALSPGEPFPAESPTNTPSDPPSARAARPKLGTGAIAGIAIASVAGVVLGGLLLFFWGRFKGLRDELRRKDSTVVRTSSPRSPRLAFWPSAAAGTAASQSSLTRYPSPPPVSSHAKPVDLAEAPPPAYCPSPMPAPTPDPGQSYNRPPPSNATTTTPTSIGGSGGMIRSASPGIEDGTLDLPPKGYYKRTLHDSPRTSDTASLVDPSLIPVGPYGRQVMDLQRQAARSRSSGIVASGRGSLGTADGLLATYYMTQQGPVEMDGTSVHPAHGSVELGNIM